MNAKNILKKDKKKVDFWTKMLNDSLAMINNIIHDNKNFNEYQKFEEEFVHIEKSMVGCYLVVFIKRRLCNRMKAKSFQICKVKTGALGTTGNKGAVCIRFQLDDQRIMAINCHLISGRRREEQRNEQIAKIFEAAFQNNLRNRGMAIENHEQVIFLGDLNFRINAFTREEVLQRINGNKCD